MEILEVLVVLRQDLEKVAAAELRIAMDLRRCNVPVSAIDQAAKRNDERGVYTELLKKFGRTSEGLMTGGSYVTIVSGQSENEAKDMAYRSAISVFANRKVDRPSVRKLKDSSYWLISSGKGKNKIQVIVEKLKVVEMDNGHAMCGIVARLATPADFTQTP